MIENTGSKGGESFQSTQVHSALSGLDLGRIGVNGLEKMPSQVAILDDTGEILYTNRAWREFASENGVTDSPDMIGMNYLKATNGGDSAIGSRTGELLTELLDGDRQTFSLEYPCDSPDQQRWFLMEAVRFRTDGEPYVLVVHVEITARKRTEQESNHQLATFQETVYSVLHADSREDIAEIAVTALANVIEDVLGTVYLYDESEGVLTPTATTPAMSDAETLPTVNGDDSTVWAAFSRQQTMYTTATATQDETADGQHPLVQQVTLPLGEHGVMAIGSPRPGGFAERNLEYASGLAATIELGLEYHEQNRRLADHDRRLQERDARLEAVLELYEVVRDVIQVLQTGSSRAEIESGICEQFVSMDGIALAWIGTLDQFDDTFDVRAWASDDGHVPDWPVSDGRTSKSHPAREALETGELAVCEDLSTQGRSRWVAQALVSGFQAAIAVPLVYRGSHRGVLTLFADQSDAFDSKSRSVLSNVIGPLVAQTLSAIDRKQGVLADRHTELAFQITDEKLPLVALAKHLDCELRLREIVPTDEQATVTFIEVDGCSPTAVAEAADEMYRVELASVFDDGTVKLRYENCIGSVLAEQGCMVTDVTADGKGARVTVGVPNPIDSRRVVETVEATYSGVQLLAKQDQRPVSPDTNGGTVLEQALTSRQREVLEAAFRQEYVAWPRETTGEDVASHLDITQPTFNQHLWTALEELLAWLFDRGE